MNILITGTSSGFGELIVKTLAAEWHTVFVTMRGVADKNAVAAEGLNRWAASTGSPVHVLELDVTDDGSVGSAVGQALEIGDHIDAVVNNAGGYTRGDHRGLSS